MLSLRSTWLPIATLLAITAVTPISTSIMISITVAAGSVSAVAVAGYALRGIALLEACSYHLRAGDGVASTALSPIALLVRTVLVSRIIFGFVISWARSIPTYRVFSLRPLIGNLHEVSSGGWANATELFLEVFHRVLWHRRSAALQELVEHQVVEGVH